MQWWAWVYNITTGKRISDWLKKGGLGWAG